MKAKLLLALVPVCSFACSSPRRPSLETFTRGMNVYLEQRGDLCLGKTSWPLPVSDRELKSGQQRDAVQMPVLEKLGLVTSTRATIVTNTEDVPVSEPGRKYELTASGRRFYVVRSGVGRDGAAREQGDFCPVKLSLDKVTRFELEAPEKTATHAAVSYRYRVTVPDWLKDADALRVFPAVARVIAGAGTAELKEGFTLTSGGWVATDLLAAETSLTVSAQKVAQRP